MYALCTLRYGGKQYMETYDEKLLIGSYPEGYDLSLLNTIYHYPRKDSEGKWSLPAIDLIIKDNVSGEKFLHTIENPLYEYYMILGDKQIPHYTLEYAPIEDCKRILVPYNQLQKDIMTRLNMLDDYYTNIKMGNRSANKSICNNNPAVLLSDQDIEDNIRFQFSNVYKNSYTKPSKSYLDIEVDTIDCEGDFVLPGECPINAVSFIDDKTLTVHSFLLRNTNNPLIQEFENNTYSRSLEMELKQFVMNTVGKGNTDKIKKYKIDKFSFQFHFFDEEIELIQSLFNYINNLKPDLVLAWNASFDFTYIIERIKTLGYNPKDIICHPDFKYRECEYVVDERNQFVYEERNDYAKISSYSIYTDQMIHFASRRKGGKALPSYKLDYTGETVCEVNKLDYSHITTNLAQLPYLDYKTFVFYNIMDTIVQYCIETKSNDLDAAYNNVLVDNTRWAKIYRQTTYLKNRAAKSYYNMGFISGNNPNQNTPKTKFPGAFVANPALNSDYCKMRMEDGQYISVMDNLSDEDFTALYPSVCSEDNMSRNTLIAHISIPDKVYEYENRFHRDDTKWKRESQFGDEYQSHCWLDFFNHWFHFASYEEMYDDVVEYFTSVRRPDGIITFHDFDNVTKIDGADLDKNLFIYCDYDDERDKNIAMSLIKQDRTIAVRPEFDFDNSDFKCFKDIYESLSSGYKYSKPRNIDNGDNV